MVEDEGGKLRDEWAIEAFYEAAITDNFRVGANAIYVRPGIPTGEDVVQFGMRVRATF